MPHHEHGADFKQLKGQVGNKHSKHNNDAAMHQQDWRNAIVKMHSEPGDGSVIDNLPFNIVDFEQLIVPNFLEAPFAHRKMLDT